MFGPLPSPSPTIPLWASNGSPDTQVSPEMKKLIYLPKLVPLCPLMRSQALSPQLLPKFVIPNTAIGDVTSHTPIWTSKSPKSLWRNFFSLTPDAVSSLVLLLLFYRAASEGWQPPMSKEDTRESSLTQKCYWHRIIPEVGGHFDPCTKQGTPTTRRRPPLVGLKECSQMHKRGWNNIEKKASHYY